MLDYSTAYAQAWERAFDAHPTELDPLAYWPMDRWGVKRLAGTELEQFRACFDDEFWSTVPAIAGAVEACHALHDAGHTVICVSALELAFEGSRLRNLRNLGFPIERFIATGATAGSTSRARPRPSFAMTTDSAEQVSRRHHYVPQFLLREWQKGIKGGFWLYARNPKGELRYKRRGAAAVGFVNDLYSLRPDFPSLGVRGRPDRLERDFFEKVDTDAAAVHQKLLIDDRPPLTQAERYAWARFVNSLLERSPWRIAEIERIAFASPTIQALMSHPRAINLRDGHLKADLDAMLRNNLLQALTRFIDHPEHIAYFAGLRWRAVDIGEPAHFLIGDNPLVVNMGANGTEINMLTLAISPRRLLFMYRDHESLTDEFMALATLNHTPLLVQQTRTHLISSKQLTDVDGIKYARIASESLSLSHGPMPS